jgi:4-aminobutyrate aminotransferase-like enzyme/Ser/Thr protein kinase RdoA (MazF antagonist)
MENNPMPVVRFHPPTFTTADAVRIARDIYGLTAAAQPLASERDQNFHLQTADRCEFVLKIAHAGEERDILDLQIRAAAHLVAHHVPVQQVISTTGGEPMVTIPGSDGAKHFVRLLTYLPGALFARVRPHTPALLHSLGALLGRTDTVLAGFSHPAAARNLKWDLRRAAWIKEYLSELVVPERRQIVSHFVARFEREVLPALPMLPSGVIYNDANDYNVVVGPGPERQVVGLIDFGDMVETITICELAIACAYAMLDKPDPLTAAAHVVAGYHSAHPLTEPELVVLYDLICMRLSVSVTNSAYQQRAEPDNAYLVISENPAWALLDKLRHVDPQLAHCTFRKACDLPPSPTAPELVKWLGQHANTFAGVIRPSLKVGKTLAFDLSIGSRELGNMRDWVDLDRFTRRLFDRMAEAGATVGIGRYDEVRPIYAGPLFRVDGNDGPEFRTVHLGLDLFLAAGSPVYAPLDGIVHSFRNNSGRLDYGPTIILRHNVDDGRLTFYSLFGHLSVDSLDGLVEGMHIEQGTEIARIGDGTVNGGWPPHLHFQLITDLLGRCGEFPGVALPAQRELWRSICPDPNLVLGVPGIDAVNTDLAKDELLKLRREHIGRSLSTSYQNPLKIVRGSMQYLYDDQGRAYLDAVNNVSHVGHCHPRVVKAGQEQMAVLNTNSRYLHDNLVRYAERLCATLPNSLSVCFFVCSGSEANELALRLARTHTKRRDMVVVDVAYHGNTTALIDISPYKHNGPGGEGAPRHVHTVPMPDDYRGPYRRDDAQAGSKYAAHVREAIRQAQARGGDVAAFICESLPSCGGQIVLPDGFLSEAYRHIREAGGVCIADEVQVGFGRVGTHFWGFETQGVVPDIVTLGKPIGNGHPLAAVVTTQEIADSFNNGMEYFNTFGGNPVSCAIGLAVLDVIADERLQENALRVGSYLLERLRQLMTRHRLIGDVRGLGLFVGLELVLDRDTLEPAPAQASYASNRMRECGILLSTDGPYHNVLKIKPPMVFGVADADFLVETLDHILDEDALQV